MPSFYYIDLYYDLESAGFKEIVEGCLHGLVDSGARLDRLIMPAEDQKALVRDYGLVPDSIESIATTAREYLTHMDNGQNHLIPYPPGWGRVRFAHDFEFDIILLDDMEAEEADVGTSSRYIGVSFMYTASRDMGRKMKATISLWDDFVLMHGKDETHVRNMKKIIAAVLGIYRRSRPYFGAMNNEMRLHTDDSLEKLKMGGIPTGNDFVLVGEQMMAGLNVHALRRGGHSFKLINNSAVLIQFTDRWHMGSIL